MSATGSSIQMRSGAINLAKKLGDEGTFQLKSKSNVPMEELEDSAIAQLIKFEEESIASGKHDSAGLKTMRYTDNSPPSKPMVTNLNLSPVSYDQRGFVNQSQNPHTNKAVYKMDLNMAMEMSPQITHQNTAVSPDRRKVFNLMQQRQFGGAINAALAAEKMQSPLRNMAITNAKTVPKRSDASSQVFGGIRNSKMPQSQAGALHEVMGSESTAIFEIQSNTVGNESIKAQPIVEEPQNSQPLRRDPSPKGNFEISPAVLITSYKPNTKQQLHHYALAPIQIANQEDLIHIDSVMTARDQMAQQKLQTLISHQKKDHERQHENESVLASNRSPSVESPSAKIYQPKLLSSQKQYNMKVGGEELEPNSPLSLADQDKGIVSLIPIQQEQMNAVYYQSRQMKQATPSPLGSPTLRHNNRQRSHSPNSPVEIRRAQVMQREYENQAHLEQIYKVDRSKKMESPMNQVMLGESLIKSMNTPMENAERTIDGQSTAEADMILPRSGNNWNNSQEDNPRMKIAQNASTLMNASQVVSSNTKQGSPGSFRTVQKKTSQGTQAAWFVENASKMKSQFGESQKAEIVHTIHTPDIRTHPRPEEVSQPFATRIVTQKKDDNKSVAFASGGNQTQYLPSDEKFEDPTIIHNNITGQTHTGWPRRFAKPPGFASLMRRGSHKTNQQEGTVGGLYGGNIINQHLNVKKKQVSPRQTDPSQIQTLRNSEASSPTFRSKPSLQYAPGYDSKVQNAMKMRKRQSGHSAAHSGQDATSNKDILEHIIESQGHTSDNDLPEDNSGSPSQKMLKAQNFNTWIDNQMVKVGSQPTITKKNISSKKDLAKDQTYRNSTNGSPMLPTMPPGQSSFGTAFVASVEVLPNLRDIIERNNDDFGQNSADGQEIHHGQQSIDTFGKTANRIDDEKEVEHNHAQLSQAYLGPVGTRNTGEVGGNSESDPQAQSTNIDGSMLRSQQVDQSPSQMTARIANNSSDLKPLNQYITSDRIVIKERGGRVSGILSRDNEEPDTANAIQNVHINSNDFIQQTDNNSQSNSTFDQPKNQQVTKEQQQQTIIHEQTERSTGGLCDHFKHHNLKEKVMQKQIQKRLPDQINVMLGSRSKAFLNYTGDMDQLIGQNLQAISLTKRHREKQAGIDPSQMSPSLRQEMSAMEKMQGQGFSIESGKVMKVNPPMLVRDQEQYSAASQRPKFNISNTGWNNTMVKGKGDEGPRLKSMSEMRHDLIVHETNEDVTQSVSQQQQDEQSKAPNTMSTKHMISGTHQINSKHVLRTLANSVHSNDSGSDADPSLSNINGLGRSGGIKKMELMVTRSSQMTKHQQQHEIHDLGMKSTNVFINTGESILIHEGKQRIVVEGGVNFHKQQSKILQKKRQIANQKNALSQPTSMLMSQTHRAAIEGRNNVKSSLRVEPPGQRLNIVGVKAGMDASSPLQKTGMNLKHLDGKGSPHILLETNQSDRSLGNVTPLLNNLPKIKQRNPKFTHVRPVKGSNVNLIRNDSNDVIQEGADQGSPSSLRSGRDVINIQLNEDSTQNLLQQSGSKFVISSKGHTKEIGVGQSQPAFTLHGQHISPNESYTSNNPLNAPIQALEAGDDTEMRRRVSNSGFISDEDASKLLLSTASPDQNPLTSKFSKMNIIEGQRINQPSDLEYRDVSQAYKQVQQNLIIGESQLEYTQSQKHLQQPKVREKTITPIHKTISSHQLSRKDGISPTVSELYQVNEENNAAHASLGTLRQDASQPAGKKPNMVGTFGPTFHNTANSQDTLMIGPSGAMIDAETQNRIPTIVSQEEQSTVPQTANIMPEDDFQGQDMLIQNTQSDGLYNKGEPNVLSIEDIATARNSMETSSQGKHLQAPAKTTVFMTTINKESQILEMNQGINTNRNSQFQPAPSQVINSSGLQSLPILEYMGSPSTTTADITKAHTALMPLNNNAVKPKYDQTRKPLDKLLTSDQLDEFRSLLGQCHNQGKQSYRQKNASTRRHASINRSKLPGLTNTALKQRSNLQTMSVQNRSMNSESADLFPNTHRHSSIRKQMFGIEAKKGEQSQFLGSGVTSPSMGQPHQPLWSPKAGETALGTPFVFNDVNFLKQSVHKNKQLLVQNGLEITRKASHTVNHSINKSIV